MSNRHIDGFNSGEAPPSEVGYTVRLTNSFTEPLATVHLLIARSGREPVIQAVSPLPPGATAAMPVGTMDDLLSYAVCAYDTQGHAIAMLPPDRPGITPVEAASSLPFRPDLHTDDWTLEPSLMLDMTQPYTVTVLNKTPDVWEEVTVFYSSAIEGTVGFSSSAVDPEGRVTFDLGPAGAMDGYAFAVWVDGLRSYLAPGTLQFPAEGLMTARRAAETKHEFHANSDTWTIGEDP